MTVYQHGVPLDDLDGLDRVRVRTLAEDAGVVLIAIFGDQLIFLRDEFTEVDWQVDRREARVARVARVVDNLRRRDQILGGQATAIDAGTAQGARFGHGGRLAEILGSP